MARATVSVDKTSAWSVEARRLEHVSHWTFDDKGEARWFAGVARRWYCASCPTCATADATTLELRHCDVIVSCGCNGCDFARRVARPRDMATRGAQRSAGTPRARAEPFAFTAGADPHGPCICCDAHAEFTILLACIGDCPVRYYIPNQVVRRAHTGLDDVVRAVPLCVACLQAVQHNLQDTLARLRRERDSHPSTD